MGARHQFDVVTQALLYQYLGKLGSGVMGSSMSIRDCQRDLLSLKGELLLMNWFCLKKKNEKYASSKTCHSSRGSITRGLLSFCVNYERNKITYKRQSINVFLVIFLQVTLSNLKTSARRLQVLDHFFPSHTSFIQLL